MYSSFHHPSARDKRVLRLCSRGICLYFSIVASIVSAIVRDTTPRPLKIPPPISFLPSHFACSSLCHRSKIDPRRIRPCRAEAEASFSTISKSSGKRKNKFKQSVSLRERERERKHGIYEMIIVHGLISSK